MAYDLSVGSYQNKSFSVAARDSQPSDIAFNDDGSKMFILGLNQADVFEYDLTINYDPTSATYSRGLAAAAKPLGAGALGLAFNADGTKMFIVGTSQGVDERTLGTGFDLSTAQAAVGQPLAPYVIQAPQGIAFNTNGTKMFIVAAQLRQIVEITLTTGFDTTTMQVPASATYDYGANVQAAGIPTGIAFSDDGKKMFISESDQGIRGVYYFTLTTAFDITTVSNFTVGSDYLDVSNEDTVPTGIVFNGNGTRIFVLGDTNNTVFEYSSGTVSSGGGDPYIIPMKGPMYKLPDEKACYRFYENGNTIINTRVSYFDKSKEIEKYFTNNEYTLNPIKKGYWFDKLYINVAGNACIFDLKTWCWLTNKKAINFFKFKPCKKFSSENNEYINGDKCISLKITWEINNKKTGIIVQSYKNPQIDNNIVMINPLFENSYGLSVRNYKPRLTKIKKLTNVSSIKSKIIKAKNKYTQKCVRKPGETWWKDGKLKAIGNKTF